MENTFKQNDRVEFNEHPLAGTGKICGVATMEYPILGKTYIVELDDPIDGYPYTHAALFERSMKKI